MAKPGNEVELAISNEKIAGTLLPSQDKDNLVLKLKSGYNYSISKKKVSSIKILQKQEKKELTLPHMEKKPNLKSISILHTGGTVASSVDYATGAVTAKFTPEDLLSMFPELRGMANLSSRLVRNMASDDMRFAHYNLLAEEIKKEISKGADGIIITHGTDTMHYTSAALSFSLSHLPVPVLLVGSQRSSDRGSTDASLNLKAAVSFIVNSDFAEVAICMHASMNDDMCLIMQGTKARKMHSSRRDAFKPVNCLPLAEVENDKINILRGDYSKADKNKVLSVSKFNEKLKIGILKSHPQMFAAELKPYEKFDGLILEGTGLGHMPISEIDEFTAEHKKILSGLKKLAKKIPVVMSTQTIYGRVNMNVYSPGRVLQEIGILGNLSDLTPETAFIKLAWLLSAHPKSVRKMFSENLKGEISGRIGTEFEI